jgi:hypothetical protein
MPFSLSLPLYFTSHVLTDQCLPLKALISGTVIAAAISTSSIAFPKAASADPVIASGRYGCAEFKLYQAWWGQYMFLNRCAALQVADAYGITNSVVSTISSRVPAAYRLPISLGNLYANSLKNSLRTCAAKNGQAYMRFYTVLIPRPMVLPYVSCN